jgi:D-arabinose 1-dehydrogenase-like Zn-dependent alcohol dehydrogenase
MSPEIPKTQTSVQLVGPDELVLNENKAVPSPGPYQILAKAEAVGLCFSDLKLLKQFDSHVRKGPVISGIEPQILSEIPSYVPRATPTVPGHEAVVRVCAIGERVESVRVGGRYLVQTDYRWLHTASSNASFGYNFEGALQEYVLMDERVTLSPEGDSMLIPVSDLCFCGSFSRAVGLCRRCLRLQGTTEIKNRWPDADCRRY